ncbi:MAG TPA: hypothetical protein PKV21_07430 [bacterium]|nr:hypothetical protein [bacterium]
MNKGNYYKKKTKEFLEKQGYVVEYLEKIQRIYTKGKLIFVKRDLFGADLIALSKQKCLFIQVKSGGKNTGINIKKAIEEFNKYPFPDFIDRWIVVWKERVKEPEIIDIKEILK